MADTQKFYDPANAIDQAPPSTSPVEITLAGKALPLTVWVESAGSSVTVQYRLRAGGNLTAWPPGAVTANAQQTLMSPVYSVVFTAGNITGVRFGVC